jgi:hypothetical protein
LRIKLTGICESHFYNFHQADNAGWGDIGVIEKGPVTYGHRAHVIAGLVVADAIPERSAFGLEVINAIDIWFAFH